MISFHLEHGSAAVAAICLAAAGLGFTSAVHDAGSHSALFAALGPQEAQQWIDVAVGLLNKLFALTNVAIGVWQAIEVARHHRRKPKPKP